MKTSKLLAFGLVSFTALGLATQTTLAAAVDGDPIEAGTTGKVTFSTKSDIVIPNPDGPGTVEPEVKPGGGSNTTDPDLKIMFVPNFIFGETVDGVFKENVQYDSIKGNDFAAMQQVVTVMNEDGTVAESAKTVDNFAQIYNSKQITNWKFTVKASTFETAAAKKQDSMLISLNNVTVADATSQFGKIATVSGDPAKAKALTPNQAVEIGAYTDAASEGAVNTFKFAPSADKAGVTLDVPKGLDIKNDETYTSNLTWTIASDIK